MTRASKTYSLKITTPVLAVTAVMVLLLVGCSGFFPDDNELVSISVSPANSSLKISSTLQFMAIGTFGNSTSRDISSSVDWTSSSQTVAIINSSGIATGYSTGNTTITATQGKKSGSTSLAVTTKGTGLEVSPSFQTIGAGQTVQFSVSLNGSSVSGALWSSSNTTVATIKQNGVATGLTAGTTTIMATATVGGTQYQGTALLTVQ